MRHILALLILGLLSLICSTIGGIRLTAASEPDATERQKSAQCANCFDSFRLDIHVPDGAVPNQLPEIVAEFDGHTTSCKSFYVPSQRDTIRTCGDPDLMVAYGRECRERDCKGDSKQLRLEIGDAPKNIKVTIRRDGVVVASRTFKPSYTDSETRSPDCPPRCREARLSWDLDKTL